MSSLPLEPIPSPDSAANPQAEPSPLSPLEQAIARALAGQLPTASSEEDADLGRAWALDLAPESSAARQRFAETIANQRSRASRMPDASPSLCIPSHLLPML